MCETYVLISRFSKKKKEAEDKRCDVFVIALNLRLHQPHLVVIICNDSMMKLLTTIVVANVILNLDISSTYITSSY